MARKYSVPRGTADALPGDSSRWQFIENKARLILNSYGYQEIRTPLFEETELFARSMGQTSEVVQKQMLSLASSKVDSDANALSGYSLRPEGTASVVRSYIEHGLDRQDAISKLYYIGPMFRGERPQKGRLRQFHQIGAEAIGPETLNPYLDAEMISLSVKLLKAFGADKPHVKVNTLGNLEDKERFAKLLREKLKPFLGKLSSESQKRFQKNVFRILDSKSKEDQDVIKKIDFNLDYLCQESQRYFECVKAALQAIDVPFTVDHTLVRGLDYYTHTVFEITHDGLGSQDAVGAGGRYNNLVSELGGPKVDAVGFALGIERIMLALSGKTIENKGSLDAFVIAVDEAALKQAFSLVAQLRDDGLACDLSYKAASMKNHMRHANKVNAKYVLLLGEDELKSNSVTIKNMTSGNQSLVSLNVVKDIIQILKT